MDNNKKIILTYRKLELPKISEYSSEKIKDFLINISDQIAGEEIEISNEFPKIETCLAFCSAMNQAEECIFSISNREKFLLFSYQNENIIRDENISLDIFEEIFKLKKKALILDNLMTPSLEETIDLDILWADKKEENFTIQIIKEFLSKLKNEVKPAFNIYLKGDVPLLVTILTLLFVRSLANKIFYITQAGEKIDFKL